MSEIIKIADAVVTELGGGGFAPPYICRRLYLPRFDLKEMDTLHVTVVPKGITAQPGSRSLSQCDYAIDLAIQKRLAPLTTNEPLEDKEIEELDALMDQVELIADHLRFRTLAEYPDAAWVKVDNDPVYSVEHLEQMRQFTSVLTVTYRTLRAGGELPLP